MNSIVLYGTESVTPRAHPTTPQSSPATATDLTLCIALLVAFVIFITVLAVMFRLLRKKSSDQGRGVGDGSHGATGMLSGRKEDKPLSEFQECHDVTKVRRPPTNTFYVFVF